MSQHIESRFDFSFIFEVRDGNPNGDPDAGNSPRVDPETGHGFVSDVCIKRKIRNYICLAKRDGDAFAPGFDIYVKERGILNNQHARAYNALGLDPAKKGKEAAGNAEKARAWMCQTFFDIRMFGAVMSTGVNCGQVRGPVQLTFARSVDPIVALDQAITRMAVTTPEDAAKQSEKQEGQARTMGRKSIVPYGLYEAHGFISPHLATDTGFSEDDLALLWEALGMMFEHDRSAARGEMSARRLIVFEHESPLGNAPAHRLFERLSITRKDESRPARAYSDYEVKLDTANLPKGIKVHEMI